MKKNTSPWLHQLELKRPVVKVADNIKTDILIIGAGIAGVTTAYSLLKNTNKNITIVEADLAGHGASGHNAGQLTTYFERPLSDIATQFGVELACGGQKDVESAWDILDNMRSDMNLKTHIYKFTGYAGMTELKHVLLHLTDNLIRYDGGISVENMLIADNYEFLDQIPQVFSHLYEVTSHLNIMNLLETNNTNYIAALAYPKGATNSAKLCEEILTYLSSNHKDRFGIFEKSKIDSIELNDNKVISLVGYEKESILPKVKYEITSDKVILCTNGFENFVINNNAGDDINVRFHAEVSGLINFMSAYLDNTNEDPIAISYFPKEDKINKGLNDVGGEPYFYITRRPHVIDGKELGLISTGGPERLLLDGEEYSREDYCEDWAEKNIDEFLQKNYKKVKGEKVNYDFCWHGLLGYTTSGIRLIGEEPNNKRLLYNLGCNGVGIMPSIFGSKKISEIINNIPQAKSIFDPKMK